MSMYTRVPVTTALNRAIISSEDNVLNCNFLVVVNFVPMGFQSVSGISRVVPKETVDAGGYTRYSLSLNGAVRELYELTFRRGFIVNRLAGVSAFADVGNANAIAKSGLGAIFVLSHEAVTRNSSGVFGTQQYLQGLYYFTSEGMKEWSLGNLNAQSGKGLIETFTVTHRGLKSVPVPYWEDWTDIVFGTSTWSSLFNDGNEANAPRMLSPQ